MEQKNKKIYDVIIVGAGLGGLYLAKLLEKSNLKILLIDKKQDISSLTKNYFGTFLEDVKRHKLEKYVLYKCGWGMYSTKEKYFNKLKNRELCVLKMNPWAQSLNLNCEIKTNTKITSFKNNDDGTATIRDNKRRKYTGKIIVDASGIAQALSPALNIKKSKIDFLNYVYVMDNVKLKNKQEMFYFEDAKLTNCGGWFHTLENGKCLVGCAEYTVPGSLGSKELKKRLNSYLKNFDPLPKYLKDAKIVEEFCLAGPTTTAHTSVVEDNYLSIGDAAGAGGPFIGDGFRMALAMAQSAEKVILQAFQDSDFSRRSLKQHQINFHQEFEKWYTWSYLFRFIYIRYFTNKELNLLPPILRKKVSDDDYYAILTSKFTPLIIIKLFTPRLVALTIKNAFIYHILEPLGIAKLDKRPDKL